MPNFSLYISLCTLQQKVKMLTKGFFWDLWWLLFDWQSCLYEKKRVLECLVLGLSWGKGTVKTLYQIVYSNMNLDLRMDFEQVLCQAFGMKVVIFIWHCSSDNFRRHTFLWMEWTFWSNYLKIYVRRNELSRLKYNLEINFIWITDNDNWS